MTTIDEQRIEAVRMLERLGYTFVAGRWTPPANHTTALISAADMLHALLVARAVAITELVASSIEGTGEQHELAAIVDAIKCYKNARWPCDKVDGGRG